MVFEVECDVSYLSEKEDVSCEADNASQTLSPIPGIPDMELDVDSVMEIYNKIKKFPAPIEQKFQDLNIHVHWTLPISHSMPTSLRNCETRALHKCLKKEGHEIKTGSFSVEENQLIVNNWESFKKEYDFDDPRYFLQGALLHSVFNQIEKRKFVQYLARGLPFRSLRQVYDKFNRLFADVDNGRFTQRDDRFIMAVHSVPSRYFNVDSRSHVAELLLQRKRNSIQRRYRLLKNDKTAHNMAKHIDWNMKLMEDMVKSMMNCKGVEKVSELKNNELDHMEWTTVGNEIGVAPVHAKYFWLSHLSDKLFAKTTISRNKLRANLILWFHTHRTESWSEIRWFKLSEKLHAPAFLLFKSFRNMVTTYVPSNLWHDLQDCIKYLYENYLKLFTSDKLKDYNLERLKLTVDGRLVAAEDHESIESEDSAGVTN